jgi:hypothetical protein
MRRIAVAFISVICIDVLFNPALLMAEDIDSISLDEIAIELLNPVTNLVSVATDIEYRSYAGDLPGSNDQSNTVFVIRPSFPIPLKNGKSVLMRASIPIYSGMPVWKVYEDNPLWIQDYDYPDFRLRQSPQITADTGQYDTVHAHLGDIGFDFAYGGENSNGFISMYGISTVLKTSTNLSASRNQMLLGPEVAFGKRTNWGIYGAWLTHLTNVSDGGQGGDLNDTNETYVEIFFAYGLNNGWQLFSSPKITYDWEADSGNELLLPLGAGISKTTRLGNTPLRLAFEIQKFVVSPDRFGADWLFTFSLTPVFSNPFGK